MTWFETWRGAPAAEAIGWALVHFIWQGAIIAIVAAVAMHLLRKRSANARYLVGCVAMLMMVVAPVATMTLAWSSAAGTGPSPAAGATPASTAWFGAPTRVSLTVVWLIGVLLLQARLILHWTNAQHLKRLGTRAVAPRWESALHDLCAQLGVRAPVRLLESTCASVPMIIGWVRPVILIPTSAFTGLSPEQLRAIIAHELSHVRRHDYLVNLAQAVCETLLFYHPAVWWLSRRIRVEREYCCDDLAVRVCGDRLCYVKALSRLDEMRCDEPGQPVLASTGGSLMDRIGRIAGVQLRRSSGGWAAPLIIAGSLTVAVSALAVGALAEAPVTVRPIDQIDVLEIVRAHEPEQAGMLEVLADAGVDNAALVVVLEELGAEPRVLEAIEWAEHREAFVEDRMIAPRAKVSEALANGAITVDEATRKLELMRVELRTRYDHDRWMPRHAQHAEEILVRKMAEMRERAAERIRAGEMDEQEAARFIVDAQRKLNTEAKEMHRAADDPAGARSLIKRHLHELEADVKAQVAEGTLSLADAKEQIRRAQEHAHHWLDAQSRVKEGKAAAYEELAALELERIEHETARHGHRAEHLMELELEARRHAELIEAERALVAEHDAAAATSSTGTWVGDLKARVASETGRFIRAHIEAWAEHHGHGSGAGAHHGVDERHRAYHDDEDGAGHDDAKKVEAGEWKEHAVRLERLEHQRAIERELAASTERPAAEAKAQWLDAAEAHKKHAVTRWRSPDRHRLTDADRAALRTGLAKARERLEQMISKGALSQEQAAERRERIDRLERTLAGDRQTPGAEGESDERTGR